MLVQHALNVPTTACVLGLLRRKLDTCQLDDDLETSIAPRPCEIKVWLGYYNPRTRRTVVG